MKRWQKLAMAGATATAIASAMTVDWEGRVYRAHYDTYAKIWDICSGHTKGVKPGDVATEAQCDAYLKEDMANAEAAVRRCIHVPLNEPQRAAFNVAAFNLGPSVVCGSTLQAKANSGDLIGACLELTDALDKKGNRTGWSYAGGVRVQGLANRRTDERNACLGYFR
jgi:lysozyme